MEVVPLVRAGVQKCPIAGKGKILLRRAGTDRLFRLAMQVTPELGKFRIAESHPVGNGNDIALVIDQANRNDSRAVRRDAIDLGCKVAR